MRMRRLTLSAALLAASCGRDEVIGIGQNIHHDDFEYSVQSVERKDRIGSLHANGLFYVVTFEVRNGAKQVEHTWSNGIAYVVDRQGRQYEVDAHAQQALAATRPFGYKDRYVTPAGATESTVLVFDLPAHIEDPGGPRLVPVGRPRSVPRRPVTPGPSIRAQRPYHFIRRIRADSQPRASRLTSVAETP